MWTLFGEGFSRVRLILASCSLVPLIPECLVYTSQFVVNLSVIFCLVAVLCWCLKCSDVCGRICSNVRPVPSCSLVWAHGAGAGEGADSSRGLRLHRPQDEGRDMAPSIRKAQETIMSDIRNISSPSEAWTWRRFTVVFTVLGEDWPWPTTEICPNTLWEILGLLEHSV